MHISWRRFAPTFKRLAADISSSTAAGSPEEQRQQFESGMR